MSSYQHNFLATDDVERASSVESIFSDIMPTDFVKAVSELGPDHLVEAMYEAVNQLKVEEQFQTATPPRQFHHQQQQHASPIFQHQPQNQKAIMINQQQQQVALLQTMVMTLLQMQQQNQQSPESNATMNLQQQLLLLQQQNQQQQGNLNYPRSSSTGGLPTFVANDSAPMDHDLHDSRSTSFTASTTASTQLPPQQQQRQVVPVSGKDQQIKRKSSSLTTTPPVFAVAAAAAQGGSQDQEHENAHLHRSVSATSSTLTATLTGASSKKKQQAEAFLNSIPSTTKNAVDEEERKPNLVNTDNNRRNSRFPEPSENNNVYHTPKPFGGVLVSIDSAIDNDDDVEEDEHGRIILGNKNKNTQNLQNNNNHHHHHHLHVSSNPPFNPVVTRLKHSPSRRRAAQKSEDLRTSAIVEREDPAIVAVPAKSPKGNHFPSTPSYWEKQSIVTHNSRQNYGSASVRSPPNTPSWAQSRTGIVTPPVPRPDLQEETESADKELLERRKRDAIARGLTATTITLGDIEAENARKRELQNSERNWKVDLKRRASALSEHYKRQFSHPEESDDAGENESDVSNNGLVPDYPASDDADYLLLTGKKSANRQRRAYTPSETVFRSRAVRMSAAEHHIISASPQLHAELDGKPRVRSPYGSLLYVSELDHFVPSVPQLETAAMLSSSHFSQNHPNPATSKGSEIIERTLREGSLEMASKAMESVDRWTAVPTLKSSRNIFPGPNEYGYFEQMKNHEAESAANRRQKELNAIPISFLQGGSSSVVQIELEPNRTSENDLLSSPQLTAMLSRIIHQRQEIQDSVPPEKKNATMLLNDDGTTVNGSRRSLLFDA